jgi:hypothetical protein
MTNYSLTEIETHCRKAARGAGYHWGEVNDFGMAVRWLCANGIDGTGEALKMLQVVDANCDVHRPSADALQGATHPAICGLSLGCTLADRGLTALQDTTLNTPIIAPLIAYGVVCNAHAQVNRPALGALLGIDVRTSAPQTYVSDAVWTALNDFVHRTYVPATEESRLKGAG